MALVSSLTIKDYLLSRLSAQQETELEELYFADPASVDEIWAVFAELSEQFLRGELPAIEQSQFELRLQRSPFLREMFENEKALFDYSLANSAKMVHTGKMPETNVALMKPQLYWRWFEWLRIKPLRFAMVSIGLLFATGIWFVWQRKTAPASDQIVVVQGRNSIKTPPLPAFSPSPSPSAIYPTRQQQTSVATFFLPVQSFRSGAEATVLTIPRQTQFVRLEFQLLGNDSSSYSAMLMSESGKPIREWKPLSPQQSKAADKIVLRVPAALLPESNYVVKLRPIGADDEAFTQQFRFTVNVP